jgi:hypothetical protein
VLRRTGSPQQDEPGRPATQRIGNRPNIRQMLDDLFPQKSVLKDAIKDKSEFKDHKELIKERIKDTKELKEGIKELKEGVKEFKEFKEFKEVREGPGDRVLIETPAAGGGADVEDRVAALEANVAELTHFIVSALRPDLAASALSAEDDYEAALTDSVELQRQAATAQAIKNERDITY